MSKIYCNWIPLYISFSKQRNKHLEGRTWVRFHLFILISFVYVQHITTLRRQWNTSDCSYLINIALNVCYVERTWGPTAIWYTWVYEVYTAQLIISNPINISSEEPIWLLTTMHMQRLRRAVNSLWHLLQLYKSQLQHSTGHWQGKTPSWLTTARCDFVGEY